MFRLLGWTVTLVMSGSILLSIWIVLQDWNQFWIAVSAIVCCLLVIVNILPALVQRQNTGAGKDE